jgi:pimeloyl-ACP methyl ester carboxylesterase
MRRAGVSPDDEVMLVGHSEGGIVAVDAACHANLHRFDCTHIVTAGSPIGVVARSLPQSVQVLALENASDIVPHTDGAANPVTAGITTATVDQSATGIGPSHDLEASYVPAAEQVDASDDPSIRLFAASAAGFLSGGWVLAAPGTTTTVAERPTMRTTAYWVERK